MAKPTVKSLLDILIYVLFASVLLPIIATQINTMQDDDNFTSTELLLVGLITTFIIIGVVYGIVKTVL